MKGKLLFFGARVCIKVASWLRRMAINLDYWHKLCFIEAIYSSKMPLAEKDKLMNGYIADLAKIKQKHV